MDQQSFIEKANILHNKFYDYSLTNYINSQTKIDIICPKHDIFTQTPNNHLKPSGCPTCASSKGEKLIAKILTEHNTKYKCQFWFDDLRSAKRRPLKFDFRLDNGVLIEYDGRQHFKHYESWMSKETYESMQKHDTMKNEYCRRKGLTLMRLPYTMDSVEIEKLIETII